MPTLVDHLDDLSFPARDLLLCKFTHNLSNFAARRVFQSEIATAQLRGSDKYPNHTHTYISLSSTFWPWKYVANSHGRIKCHPRRLLPTTMPERWPHDSRKQNTFGLLPTIVSFPQIPFRSNDVWSVSHWEYACSNGTQSCLKRFR